MASKRARHDATDEEGEQNVHRKRDSDTCQCDIGKDTVFIDIPTKIINGINFALDALIKEDCFLPSITLTPLKILMCNGADKHEGFPFSKAYCSTDMYDTDYAFGTVFRKGINMLIDMFQRRTPGNRQHRFVLSRLLHYLSDMVNNDLESLEADNLTSLKETQLSSVLVNHLFGKLSASSSFVIDKQCKGKEECRKNNKENVPCPCGGEGCQLSGYYGDTSIGNELVWHGRVDTLVNNEVIVDTIVDDDDSSRSPGENSSVEEKMRSWSLIRSHQIIAETIVFSFLKKQRNREKDAFLFPCVAVSDQDMVIYFYDSFHDILLESSKIPLHGVLTGPVTGSVNLIAVLVSWLVVNHKYLCDGVVEEMKTTRAGFFSQAGSKLRIYEKYIKLGDVGNASRVSHDATENVFRKRHIDPEMIERKQLIRTKDN
ncbi:uncharacterized protein LOC110457735 [Mizuhopecten yessoensis]|uniref:Uncharacterized protein n=1 Tax=Mizuhopecten yessoensis TaxID=6573 RepID=A0A210Q869_MIZYE|nr:uncharacterized protein LOC110457735 [Mizuhopecten yessoensis]OWF44905.1 hypothetical protein KP79_PYT16709 [Mizuhopecten yessoensis]